MSALLLGAVAGGHTVLAAALELGALLGEAPSACCGFGDAGAYPLVGSGRQGGD
ncbi:hypothetical protein ACEZDB_26865 [Streptacidiphilus sp. N1-3]|uniref:Uncharacterized protein n=1 Tax=Streptacidiphilus alkalitolerans TaxID=3342712 RepID=A0ABV6X7K1_9ACTN